MKSFKAPIDSLLVLLFGCVTGRKTIKEYYELVALAIGWQGKFVFDCSKPTGMAQKLSDTSLQLKWGWQPKTTLKEGIRSTYKYYLENVF